mmetsp:Transcript_91287/g.197465  ORF Transcript_91287/g.197465 Transcript_91287/m.197465 type:complete len:214 (+) Transcript_91287:806-1447(+)
MILAMIRASRTKHAGSSSCEAQAFRSRFTEIARFLKRARNCWNSSFTPPSFPSATLLLRACSLSAVGVRSSTCCDSRPVETVAVALAFFGTGAGSGSACSMHCGDRGRSSSAEGWPATTFCRLSSPLWTETMSSDVARLRAPTAPSTSIMLLSLWGVPAEMAASRSWGGGDSVEGGDPVEGSDGPLRITPLRPFSWSEDARRKTSSIVAALRP